MSTLCTKIAAVKALASALGGALLFGLLLTNAQGAATALGSEPFTSSTKINALPNVMFILDDSGSMSDDYLPDWAGPYTVSSGGVTSVNTLAYRFYNSAYNGVAYNPATRYLPPVMYTSTGAVDTTTYPSQTGQSVATGGNSSASATAPNWAAVKVDGYGIQSTATASLEGHAFSYTTVAGEYCDSAQLRNCVASTTNTGYTFPAKLRWCHTSSLAVDTTANAGTTCQASNIADTPTNATNGVTTYTNPRMPRPHTATISVGAAGTVTSVTVNGVQILSAASVTGGSSTDLATAIAASINACTLAKTGAVCQTVGFSAVSASNVVTITAPAPPTSGAAVSPVVSGGTTTVTSFSNGSVPGSIWMTVIAPSVTSYVYPGTAAKGSNRSDCADAASCTYAEEMTNYANWYAYYRTRMQMMKTSSSIAFSAVDDKFRVGYYSINNAAGSQFLNVAAFDGAQKNLWYTKFLSAKPYGGTPLRNSLAKIGQMYAGKLSTLNGVAVVDPMQYSCQQDFTILSTDGYWNETSNPKRIDGVTDVGQQDGSLDRPYYDGGTQTKTISQTTKSETKVGINTSIVKSMTQQQQTTIQQLTQKVTTTTTYPYTLQTTPLQTRTTPLWQTVSLLNQVEYPLYSTPTQLTKYTTNYSSTTAPLNSYNNLLIPTTQKLNKTGEARITQTSTPLQASTYKITSTETNLIRSTYKLTSVTSQLQKNVHQKNVNGDGATWTGYVDASSCTTQADSLDGGVMAGAVSCQYVTRTTSNGNNNCTIVSPSSGSPYTVANPVTCTYENATTEVATGSNTDAVAKATGTANATAYAKAVTYAYATTANTPTTGQDNCTAVAQSTSSPWVGPARACSFDTSPTVSTTITSGTCTNNTPTITGSGTTVQTICAYSGTPTTATVDTCTVARSSGSSYSVLTRVDCAYDWSTWATANDVANCTAQDGNYDTSVGAVSKTYRTCALATGTGSTSAGSAATSCSFSGGAPSTGSVWLPQVTCAYQAASLAQSGVANCNAGSASTGTATGTTWNSYQTCSFGNAVASGANLTSCVPSGGNVGNAYTGPQVVCSNMDAVSAPVSACTASSPNPPSPLYSSPIVTCGYAATAAATEVSNCTPSASGATGISCAYGAATNQKSVPSCDVVSKSTSGTWVGRARDCSYADQTPTSVTTACTVVAKTSSGTHYTGPATACAYGATPTTWDTATAACTPVAQTGFVGPAVECAYNASAMVATPAGSNCAAADPGTGYSLLQKKVCVAGSNDVVVVGANKTVDSCSTAPTWDGQPVSETSVRTATTCTYKTPKTTTTATCTPSVAAVPPAYVSTVTCPVTNQAQTYVSVESCTPAGTMPATFDSTGKIVVCRTDDTTPYTTAHPSGGVPVVSCTAGYNATTKVHTTCSTLVSTGPTVVDPATCTTVDPGVAPEYLKTTCTTTSPSSTVMGCAQQLTPTAPLWQTITCADIAGSGTTNTLADVAAYYYYTDLRTTALGNCTGAPVSPALVGEDLCTKNDVSTTTKDPLSTQHMTTFTLGLGASGYMNFSSTYLTDASGDYSTVYGVSPHAPVNGITASPSTGICSWQAAGLCNWPYPASDEQTAIDDLWHAGVNGHGAYFSATDPTSLSTSLAGVLAGVAAAGGAGSAATISTPNLVSGDNYVFSSTYTTSDWTGELVRKQLDPLTSAVSTTSDWSVQAKLDANTSRTIYTFDASTGTKLKAFTSANFAGNANFLMPHISTSPDGLTQFLCASSETCLTAGDQDSSHASGANLVNYLRGDRSNEGALKDNTKYYRQRAHVLGDMVNAQVVYVTSPLYSFGDAGYGDFATARASRQAMVYAAANDGMLHAFAAKGSAATEALVQASATASQALELDPTNTTLKTAADAAAATAAVAEAADPLIGKELWAYIPTMVIPNLYRLADKKYKDMHRYFVDGTPVVGDICVSNCDIAGTAVWKTILVGGLGGGGRGYYALDITDPTNPKALWEFTDANLGYSYGNPQIVKNSAGKWVVLVTSGYNNIPNDDGAGGDGVGRLFVLDAASGVHIGDTPPISTGAGSSTTPSGLSKITAQVVNPSTDWTVEAVYGGDLLGNLWRFDINNTVGASGYDAQLLAILKDGSGNRQPITAQPEVSSIPNVSGKLVFIGTGRFLAASDASDTSQQSFYAIKDVQATGTTPATAIFDNPGGSPRKVGTSDEGFVRQIQCYANGAGSACLSTGTAIISTDNTVALASDNGWFFDLINSSERANTDPTLVLGVLAFNTNAPTLAACDVGGTSYQYTLAYLTGGPAHVAGNYDTAAKTGFVGKFLASALASSVSLVVDGSSNIHAISQVSGGSSSTGVIVGGTPGGNDGSGNCVIVNGISVCDAVKSATASIARRTSWRELIKE